MGWDYDPIDDGDLANAATFTAQFGNGSTWLNAITNSGIKRGCFNRHHAGSLIRTSSDRQVSNGEVGNQTYTNTTFGASLQYTTYGGNGGTQNGATLGNGDRFVVGHASASNPSNENAVISYAGETQGGHRVGMTNDVISRRIGGILLLGSVQIHDVTPGALVDPRVMLCFQLQLDSDNNWYTIARSERFWDYEDKIIPSSSDDMRVPGDLACLLVPSDITASGSDPSSDEVRGVRLMCSLYASSGSYAGTEIVLGSWNFIALPLFASDVG